MNNLSYTISCQELVDIVEAYLSNKMGQPVAVTNIRQSEINISFSVYNQVQRQPNNPQEIRDMMLMQMAAQMAAGQLNGQQNMGLLPPRSYG